MENKLLQQFLLPLLALISLLYAIKALGKQSETFLDSICHQQYDSKKECCLEVGNFTLYFNKKPIVNLLKTDRKNNYEEQIFFFPQVLTKGKELKTTIEKMNKKYAHYEVAITLVKKPMPGVQIKICYDRNKISCAYEEYESIYSQNGVIFRLYNKEVIEKLQSNKDKPVITVAATTTLINHI